MKITNYRTIEDSGDFAVDEHITCLVGKNESGKSAVLKALEGMKPFNKNAKKYDTTKDYPRRYPHGYAEKHSESPAEVCTAVWELERSDLDAVEEKFGKSCVRHNRMVATSYYNAGVRLQFAFWEILVVRHLRDMLQLDAAEKRIFAGCGTVAELYEKIRDADSPTDSLTQIKAHIEGYKANEAGEYHENGVYLAVEEFLVARMPEFVYFSQYSRMPGEISVDDYLADKQSGDLKEGHRLFEDFLRLAKTSVEELAGINNSAENDRKVALASHEATTQFSKYWTQKDNLVIKIDARLAYSEDAQNSGKIVRVHVEDRTDVGDRPHDSSVPLSDRSDGFIWFFSFLVHFSQVKENYTGKNHRVIVLLDEPGLSLHAKAQMDLLRYIKEKLADKYQVVYTTHSPFMIFQDRLETIRTVEYVGEYAAEGAPGELGTKVSGDFLKKSRDTVFPLQGALGYEVSQTLFIGNKVLLVEGVSDILYLKTASNILHKSEKSPLDEWTLCPVGGIGNIRAFVNLFLTDGKERTIAVLADYQKSDESKFENLRSLEYVSRVLLYSEFCGKAEADVEDIFGKALYLEILKKSGGFDVDPKTISGKKRIVEEIRSQYGKFSHKDPAMWLLHKSGILARDTADAQEARSRFADIFSALGGKQQVRVGKSKKKRSK
ncbi:MAG: AAA family ATPase [Alphaproteobacteria bacterium]|nr:AAA family ATPase [Alphaproteobacteria bacterium]MDA8001802.1 AAA family ATPase [Alphaproteobacteria bacterium]MDA8030240.1 AAA family ATPase [Alphaproteobacteria bacterium]